MPGRPLSSSAEMTKYVAAPTIAPSAPGDADEVEVGPRDHVEHQHQAERRRSPAPATVSRWGRCPWRSHSHTTTATGAVYSMSSATPTWM